MQQEDHFSRPNKSPASEFIASAHRAGVCKTKFIYLYMKSLNKALIGFVNTYVVSVNIILKSNKHCIGFLRAGYFKIASRGYKISARVPPCAVPQR